ncbi:hypothetical protein LN650_22810 [Klebsiella pneumoniae subsp. pneumoniae]|nr:hypothetical protein [Klebsiella pneumoniae subsp. pneumoniae]
MHLALAFNLSHLEIVSPVVIGSVRARLDRLDEPSSNKVPAYYHPRRRRRHRPGRGSGKL